MGGLVGLGGAAGDAQGIHDFLGRAALNGELGDLPCGSGNFTIHTGGPSSQRFKLPNVLGIGHKLKLIHTVLREREVVRRSR
jgi:hypothetical protein